MAERSGFQRSSKSQVSMRENLERWRKEKHQTAPQLKLKEQNREASKPSNPVGKISGCRIASLQESCAFEKQPCSCKAKENQASAKSVSLAHKTRKSNSKTAKGNLKRVSMSIKAANNKRDNARNQRNYSSRMSENKIHVTDPGLESSSRHSDKKKVIDNEEDLGSIHVLEPKPYENKRLTMRERLELWKAEKKHCEKIPKEHEPGVKRILEEQKSAKKLKETSDTSSKSIQKHEKRQITPTKDKALQVEEHSTKDESVRDIKDAASHDLGSSSTTETHQDFSVKISKLQSTNKIEASLVQEEEEMSSLPQTPAVKSYMDKSLDIRERLELWRQDKGKTPKYPKTPSTGRKRTTDHKGHVRDAIEPIAEQGYQYQAMSPLDPFDTMMCDAAEKVLASEELKEKLKDCLTKVQNIKYAKVDFKTCSVEEILPLPSVAVFNKSYNEPEETAEIQARNDDSDEEVASQLDVIQKSYSSVLLCAEFWMCRAKIAEHEGDHGRVVCFFEQALVFSAEPEALIKEAFSSYLEKKNASEQLEAVDAEGRPPSPQSPQEVPCPDSPKTPEQQDTVTDDLSMFNTSVVKYSVTKATPFKSRLNESCERPIVTPVRRSARLERRSVNYPTMLQEHGLTVSTLEDLPEEVRQHVMFKPNFAVQSDLNDAWKEMWEADF